MRLTLCAIAAIHCLVSVSLAADTTPAELTLAEVATRLAAPAVLRGRFEQTREIELLSEPLRSNGHFLLSDMGLYWHQEAPVRSVMIADADRLLQSVGDGPLQSVDAARNPVVLTFSRSFLSIFEGNESGLQENFDVSFQASDDHAGSWTISLVPASYPMSEAIDSIILNGREYIEDLTVISRSSEQTIISFSDLQTEPGELTEHEIELYAR